MTKNNSDFELQDYKDFENNASRGASSQSSRFDGAALKRTSRTFLSVFDRYRVHLVRSMLRKCVLMRVTAVIILCALLGVSLHPSSPTIGLNDVSYYYYSAMNSPVREESDLLTSDITGLINTKNWDKSPLGDEVKSQKYFSYSVKGYIPRLEGLKEELSCEGLSYVNAIEYSEQTTVITDDLFSVRRFVLQQKNKYSSAIVDKNAEKDLSEEQIVRKSWFKHGSSAVWLEEYQCYVVYSHIIYSPQGARDNCHISMIRGQAFDKNWVELKYFRIPYNDICLPHDIDEQVENLKKEFGYEDCNELKNSRFEYDRCVVKQTDIVIPLQKKVDSILGKYYVTYPTVFDLEVETEGKYNGQENIRVILKENSDGTHEPVVAYHGKDPLDDKSRRMFVFFPHKKDTSVLKLISDEIKLRKDETTWTPFFHKPSNVIWNKYSRGYIYFIYKFAPISIVKCNLDDGICEKEYDSDAELEKLKSVTFNEKRSGTQYVQLPSNLPSVVNRQIWVGFPEIAITDCACGRTVQRPMLDVLVESDGVYTHELIVPIMSFEKNVLNWDMEGTYCIEGKDNLMIGNSISHWDILGQKTVNGQLLYEDYMVLTYSESDIISKVITVKGLLNYVLGVFGQIQTAGKPSKNRDSWFNNSKSQNTTMPITKTFQCINDSASDQCAKYALAQRKTQ